MTIKDKVGFGLVVAVIVIIGQIGLSYVSNSFSSVGVGGTPSGMLIEDYNPYVRSNGGIKTALPIELSGSAGDLTVGDALTIAGTLTTNGPFAGVGTSTLAGLLHLDASYRNSYVNSTTTTGAAVMLSENDLGPGGKCFGTFSFTKTVGVSGGGNLSTTTLTTAASSTFANIIPTAGDWCDMTVESATSSSAQLGMIWAFGTGWDPETSSTTPTGLTIQGGSSARFRFLRKFNSDIGVSITIFKDAD